MCSCRGSTVHSSSSSGNSLKDVRLACGSFRAPFASAAATFYTGEGSYRRLIGRSLQIHAGQTCCRWDIHGNLYLGFIRAFQNEVNCWIRGRAGLQQSPSTTRNFPYCLSLSPRHPSVPSPSVSRETTGMTTVYHPHRPLPNVASALCGVIQANRTVEFS